MAERVGFEPSRGELKARRAMPWKPARADETECNEVLAERVGFEPSRGELKARRAMPWKPARADETECNEVLAERVGFEPTVEFPLHTLSKRAPSTTRPSLRL